MEQLLNLYQHLKMIQELSRPKDENGFSFQTNHYLEKTYNQLLLSGKILHHLSLTMKEDPLEFQLIEQRILIHH